MNRKSLVGASLIIGGIGLILYMVRFISPEVLPLSVPLAFTTVQGILLFVSFFGKN